MPDFIGDIEMRSGDTLPLLAVVIEDDQGVPVNLTPADHVEFIFVNTDGEDPRIRPVIQAPARPYLSLPAFIANPTAGLVVFDWAQSGIVGPVVPPGDGELPSLPPTQLMDFLLRPGVCQLTVVVHYPFPPTPIVPLVGGVIATTEYLTAPTDRIATVTVRPDPLLIYAGAAVPGVYDLHLYRGDTKGWQFRLWADEGRSVPIDLTGVTPTAQMRDRPGGTILVSMVAAVVGPNVVQVNLYTAQSMRAPHKGVWDLQLVYPAGEVQTVVSGTVVVDTDVTV